MQQLTRMACVCVLAEEVCVEEMKACAADKECSMLHEKLQAAMKKDGGYGGKGGDGAPAALIAGCLVQHGFRAWQGRQAEALADRNRPGGSDAAR